MKVEIVEADYKAALKILADNLPDSLTPIRPDLYSEIERQRKSGLNRAITQLQMVGANLHAQTREQVDEEEWEEWYRIFNAALQLRAAAWALRNVVDGSDEDWAHDRVIAAKKLLNIPHDWMSVFKK